MNESSPLRMVCLRLMVEVVVSASMELAERLCVVMVVLVLALAQRKDPPDLSYNSRMSLYPGPARRICIRYKQYKQSQT